MQYEDMTFCLEGSMSKKTKRTGCGYMHLESFSLLYSQYMIVDTSDYLADQLFIRHKVTVRFGKEYAHPQEPYLFIFCRVRKKDEERFLDALQELPNKMMLCGHPNYPYFCEEFLGRIERTGSRRRSGKEKREKEDCPAV